MSKNSLSNDLSVNPTIFSGHVKAWAIFALVIISMAVYVATIHHSQFGNQLKHGLTLRCCSCVRRLPISIEAANVTHANAVRVVTLTMRAWLANGPAMLDGAVEVYNIVVSNITPAITLRRLRGVPSLDVSCSIVPLVGGSAAVDDDVVNVPGHSYRRMMLSGSLGVWSILDGRRRAVSWVRVFFIVRKGTTLAGKNQIETKSRA